MIDRSCRLIALVAVTLAAAPDSLRPARAASYTVRWNPAGASGPSAVEVEGIDRPNLEALSRADWPPARWAELFSVVIVPEPPAKAEEPPAILGKYRVIGGALRFEPRFPMSPGLRHRARFRPSGLPTPDKERGEITSEFTPPRPKPPEPASVVRVDPSGDRLPENLLKFYLHFSKPMERGAAYEHVRLLDASGKPLEGPFLELGEELWDPTGTRLTLLLDPGRIKRGLRPREEEGPILEAGKSYTLVVDRDWPDAHGVPLQDSFRRTFRAGPADETQPDPKLWKIEAPASGTRDALTLRFPEPLDRALLERVIGVRTPEGESISGRVEVDAGETRWRLLPLRPWAEGTYQVVVETTLEDLAGNSVARPFEVDIVHPIERRIEAKTVSIPMTIRKPVSR